MKLSELRKLNSLLAAAEPPRDPEQLHTLLLELGCAPDNLYQELEMESRFAETHRDTSWSNAQVSLHSHSFVEILCCANTCGAEYLVGADRYRLQKGDIVLIPAGVSHRPLLPEHMTEPYCRDVLWLRTEFMEDLRRQFPGDRLDLFTGSRLLRTAGTKWEFLGELFRSGVQESEARAGGWEPMVVANTVRLLVLLSRALHDRSALPLKAEKPELLDRVLAYVEENLSQHISLAEIARRFYVSESTISHTFKEKMGASFYRCVTQRRLIAAKSLILKGIPLETVCQDVGFSDYSGFYRAFKQEFGIGPRQFRKLQADEAAHREAAL